MKGVLVVFLLASLAASIGLMVFSIMRPDRKKALFFTVVTASLCAYVLGYLMEVLSVTVGEAFIALRVENLGIASIAPLFLLMMLSMFYPERIKNWMFPMVLIYGFGMFLVVLFNDVHRLYYTSVDMVTRDGAAYFAKLSYGPLYVLQQIISISCILISYALVFRRYFGGTAQIKNQMKLMIIGSALSLVANIMNFSGVLPTGLDLTPMTMTALMGMLAISIFRYKMMDLVPIASTTAVETMEDAVVVLDNEGVLQYCNLSAKKLFPALCDMVRAGSVEQLDDWPVELCDKMSPGEVTFSCKDAEGAERQYRARISTVANQKGMPMGWSYVMRDMTDNVAMMKQLEELATTDPLTGVLNRRQFMHMVHREMEVAARLGLNMSLIMYDLDYFKDVNDTYGHIAGDYVLCAVANIVKNQLRSYDVFARYGGEEFMIFTTSNGTFDLFAFADRLRSRIVNSEISFEGQRILVTASFGAVRMKPHTKFSTAVRQVDIAMYRAKTQGRNQVVVMDAPAEVEEEVEEREA